MSSPLAKRVARFGFVLALTALSACVRPNVPTCPIDPADVLRQVHAERTPPQTEAAFTMPEAVAWMRRHNPEIRRARADWSTAQAVANVRTPYPNPMVDVGPLLFGGGDILEQRRLGRGGRARVDRPPHRHAPAPGRRERRARERRAGGGGERRARAVPGASRRVRRGPSPP